VDPAAFTKINQGILLATLRGFAEHGFSGDIEFRLEGRQILRTVCENHVADSPEPLGEAGQAIERNWPQISRWAEGSETLLQVMFQRGKITKVRSTDRSERWQLVQP
jgi:hypothetical protein